MTEPEPEMCFRKPIEPNGGLCERHAEVRVLLIEVSSGLAVSRDPMCPVHAYDLVGLAFRDSNRAHEGPMMVVLSPLG